MTSQFDLPARGTKTKLTLAKKLPESFDCLVVPVFQGEHDLELAASDYFSETANLDIWKSLIAVGATGKVAELTKVPAGENSPADFVLAVGLGDSQELDEETIRRATGAAARALTGVNTVVTTIGAFGMQAAVEGFGLGAYHYRGLKNHKNNAKNTAHNEPVKKVVFLHNAKGDKEIVRNAKVTVNAVNLARDLVNTSSAHLYPESYAAIIGQLAKPLGIDVEVLAEKELKKQGFGGILAVGMGSARTPRLVRLSWAPKDKDTAKELPHVAMVGKGITFDTGGISLKPGAQMDHMISDMGGSAAVVATVLAAARLKLNVRITATIPLAENMPSGHAYRPGDVITHYGGITTEVLNTDAEGRLVLADAIARACEDKPQYLLEAATLTGAQIVALGHRISGVMGSDEFRDRVVAAGQTVGEQAWAMPLPTELSDAIKSPVADLRNISANSGGGMLVAGCYLQEFVADDVQWAHIDIAGPSFNTSGEHGYTPTRATGVPVRTFLKVLSELADAN
ncbi:leucyl aminopeptidase [Corynebacterium sp. sy039]|uniref:leucyl aminopeptidase n=1 Tax=Corynebacterium sp. sy039 TaxID=2599641 RepID=UPI0011B3E398|nr:leucyl aminopeptidase [Corynebacterium sp. sy039]QDZ42955.1 leucyl aminopeptidase [Corynebacterium sp. sy039]